MRPNMTMSLVTSLVVAAAALPPAALYGGTVDRTYTAGRTALQIDQETRFVQSLEGGVMRGTVAVENDGKKHLAGVVADPIRARVGSDDFSAFISAGLSDGGGGGGKMQRVNGTIHQTDYNYKVVASRDFTDAMLTEVSFPALDGASKDAAALTIVLQPEAVRDGGKGSGAVLNAAGGGKQTKKWMSSMFRVTIPDVDASRVAKVDAITASRKLAESAVGERRDYQKTPQGAWQISNVVLHVAQSHAGDFVKWHEDFVIKGNSGEDREKTMTIEMLDPAGQTPLMTVNLSGVGILAVTPVGAEAGSEQIARSRVEMYAERLTLGGGGKAPAATATPADQAPAPAAAAAPDKAAPAPAPAESDPTIKRPAPVEIAPAPGEPAPAPVRRRTPRG
jgi:phage tail-like protein